MSEALSVPSFEKYSTESSIPSDIEGWDERAIARELLRSMRAGSGLRGNHGVDRDSP